MAVFLTIGQKVKLATWLQHNKHRIETSNPALTQPMIAAESGRAMGFTVTTDHIRAITTGDDVKITFLWILTRASGKGSQ